MTWRRRLSTTSKKKKWDAVVIGGGHNGLTAASYLARSGLTIAVLERRHLVGGAAVTEEIVPGFKFSRCSYLQSLLRPQIIQYTYFDGFRGMVSSVISKAAEEAGAHILTDSEVSRLMIDDSGSINGVILADGTEVLSSVILSNATPYKTFKELVPANALPDDFIRSVDNLDHSSGTTKINIAVEKLPRFSCCNLGHPDAGPQHMGTIHIGCESMEEIDIACQDAVNGIPSKRPIIEMTIPSALDKTISPPGKHVINLFVQYTPYKPSNGSWDDPEYRETFARRCFNLIDEYAPGFSSSVIGYDMLTPPDLERIISLTGGNIFHGAMGLDSLFLMRPVKGWSNYRTPLQGLYLCGSGAHPGGGVMGAPGRNAALQVIRDMKKV